MSGQIERHLALAGRERDALEASLARLRSSRARLNVLTSAIADVRAAVGRVTRRRAAQVRVAAVDLGTNSTRLLVADVERNASTRSCGGWRSRGSARASTSAAGCCRSRSRACATSSPSTAASSSRSAPSGRSRIATSAVRDAENGEAFLGEIEWSYGFTTRLLTGDEEAD